MPGSKDHLNLLFHTRVLGRSDKEAMIRDYCSSLDAAWEGAVASEKFLFGFKVYEGWGKPHRDCNAVVNNLDPGTNWTDHPAEALVLACLRAVGCSEEELEGA